MPSKMVKMKNVNGVYKRGSKYVIRWRHQGVEHNQAFNTLAEARAWKGKRMHGDTEPPSRVKFADYASEWLGTYPKAHNLAPSTIDRYRRSINLAITYFGDVGNSSARRALGPNLRLTSITPPYLRAYAAWMQDQRGMRAPTVHAHISALRAMFTTAYQDGEITANPAAALGLPTTENDDLRAKAPTVEELLAFLRACPEQWRPLFTLLAETGLRISECLGLLWSDVDLGTQPVVHVRYQLRGQERVRLKTPTSRRNVPLSAEMTSTLLAMRARSLDPSGPVFANAVGAFLDVRNVRHRVLKPTAAAVGLPWLGFHSLRHFCASTLIHNGRTIPQVSRWLGHKKASFTLDTYVHLMDDGIGDASCLGIAAKVTPQVIAH